MPGAMVPAWHPASPGVGLSQALVPPGSMQSGGWNNNPYFSQPPHAVLSGGLSLGQHLPSPATLSPQSQPGAPPQSPVKPPPQRGLPPPPPPVHPNVLRPQNVNISPPRIQLQHKPQPPQAAGGRPVGSPFGAPPQPQLYPFQQGYASPGFQDGTPVRHPSVADTSVQRAHLAGADASFLNIPSEHESLTQPASHGLDSWALVMSSSPAAKPTQDSMAQLCHLRRSIGQLEVSKALLERELHTVYTARDAMSIELSELRSACATLETDVEKRTKEKADLQARHNVLNNLFESQKNAAQGTIDHLRGQLHAQHRSNGEMKTEMDGLRTESSKLLGIEATASELARERDALREQHSHVAEELDRTLTSVEQKNAQVGYLKTLWSTLGHLTDNAAEPTRESVDEAAEYLRTVPDTMNALERENAALQKQLVGLQHEVDMMNTDANAALKEAREEMETFQSLHTEALSAAQKEINELSDRAAELQGQAGAAGTLGAELAAAKQQLQAAAEASRADLECESTARQQAQAELADARAALAAANAAAQRDREALDVLKVAAQRDKDTLDAALRQSARDREALEATQKASNQDTASAEAAIRQAQADRESLEQARLQTARDRDAIEHLQKRIAGDKEALDAAHRQTERDRESVEQALRQASRDKEALDSAQAHAARDREALAAAQAQSTRDRESLEAAHLQAKRDREALEAARSAKLEAQLAADDLKSKVVALEREVARKAEEVEKRVKECKSVEEEVDRVTTLLRDVRKDTRKVEQDASVSIRHLESDLQLEQSKVSKLSKECETILLCSDEEATAARNKQRQLAEQIGATEAEMVRAMAAADATRHDLQKVSAERDLLLLELSSAKQQCEMYQDDIMILRKQVDALMESDARDMLQFDLQQVKDELTRTIAAKLEAEEMLSEALAEKETLERALSNIPDGPTGGWTDMELRVRQLQEEKAILDEEVKRHSRSSVAKADLEFRLREAQKDNAMLGNELQRMRFDDFPPQAHVGGGAGAGGSGGSLPAAAVPFSDDDPPPSPNAAAEQHVRQQLLAGAPIGSAAIVENNVGPVPQHLVGQRGIVIAHAVSPGGAPGALVAFPSPWGEELALLANLRILPAPAPTQPPPAFPTSPGYGSQLVRISPPRHQSHSPRRATDDPYFAQSWRT
ncbi:hypothetical protein DIPPA_13105 [Diplonema papillatum]|nr:hypothetical protein DIPPA_13105 [Diplonema papillatum]